MKHSSKNAELRQPAYAVTSLARPVHDQIFANSETMCILPPMTKLPDFIPVDPVTLVCPRCGAKPGIVCDQLKGETDLIHIERIKAAASADARATNARTK
jgi:hypothetical protein